MKKFCDRCLKDVEVKYKEEYTTEYIDGIEIKYLEKYYICDECSHKFYDDLHDYNVLTANNELRKFYGTITIGEINDLIKKYNGIDNLSIATNIEKDRILSYIEGRNPTKEDSSILKELIKV